MLATKMAPPPPLGREGEQGQRRRVVVAEDDNLFREALAGLLERSGFAVVGQARDGNEVLSVVREQRPDVVIVDIRMPPRQEVEGLEAARTIRAELPDVGILVLSAHVEVSDAMDLLAGGDGVGYLLKSRVTRVDDFIEALDKVLRGGTVVDPGLVQDLVDVRHHEDRLAGLTPREREVLALMARGESNSGIARALWVTDGTVEKHVRSIMAKLCLSDTPDDHRRVLAVLTFLDSR
jgi:DNA-binding NarL/FixJ family response regulator